VTQPVPEFDVAHEAYEAWRDLQDVLEERDAEWWGRAELRRRRIDRLAILG